MSKQYKDPYISFSINIYGSKLKGNIILMQFLKYFNFFSVKPSSEKVLTKEFLTNSKSMP